MTQVTAVRRLLLPLLFGLITALLALAWSARVGHASLPGGRLVQPEPISPAAGATLYESGFQFAWRAIPGARKHYLLLSNEAFDPRGWTRLPSAGPVSVHALVHPIASLEQIGVRLDRDQRLFWAAADEDGAGHLSFGEVRALSALRKFSNQVEPSPYLAVSPISDMSRAPASGSHLIRLHSGHQIDPRRGEPALPEALSRVTGPANAKRTYLVYFGDADPEVARKSILARGGLVVAYVPDHAYLVRSSAPSGVSIESQGSWVGTFQPAYKLSPRLGTESAAARVVSVLVFPDGDLDRVTFAAQALGATIQVSSNNGINKLLRLALPGNAIDALARDADVAWIEPYLQPHTMNSNDQWVVQTGFLNSRRIWDLGIHGEGQVVMTSDSGVEVTHDQFRDPAVPIPTFGDYPTHRKVIAYKLGSTSPDVAFGDQASASYHGTHTACTAVGSDDPVNTSLFDGMAKGAKLYFEDLSGPAFGTGLAPFADLNDLFQPSYTGNGGGAARLSSNSWGSDVGGDYDLSSQQVDQFMWNHPDYLIFFANGNAGGNQTVASPATAKNSVGVGGTRNGSATSLQNQIYASTSRGPTSDGRRKPTICAPASTVTSANVPPSTYVGLAGTSMATPSATGCTALLRQYCTEGWYPTGAKVPANGFNPSAALLKAMLINSGTNVMTGGFQAPDNNIGYGRINADSVLYFAGDARRLILVDQAAGLGHNQMIEYQVNVTDGSQPLEVSVCWTDYPGNAVAVNQLVNNLDVEVQNGANLYKGNWIINGLSQTGGSADPVNVEEGVRVGTPATGIWTIRVKGTFVAFGPQTFGMAVTGGIGTTAGTVALDRTSYSGTSTAQLRVIDTNAGASVSVHVTSNTEGTGENVTLPGSNGVYTGSILLRPMAGTTGDGQLQVSNGDVINATYNDASPAATLVAQAGVSFTLPVISSVAASNQGSRQVVVTWRTDVNASSRVYYGSTPSLGSSTPLDPTAAIPHAAVLSGLDYGQTYYYDVESADVNGNTTRDDNAGSHYKFTVQPPGDLLLVYSGPDFERPSRYQNALGDLGWVFDTWKGALSDVPSLGNLSGGLRSYKAVWWQNGLENYPPFSAAARESVAAYMSGGGRMAVTGHDVAWALGDATSGFSDASTVAFLNNTLRTNFLSDPPTWSGVTGIAADPISGAYTGGVSYQEHRGGASGDEVSSFGPASYDWRSVEATPDNCGLRWESPGPVGTAGTAFWGGHTTRLAAMYFEWTGMDPNLESSAIRNDVMDKTLTWLLERARPTVTVLAPNGGETLTANSTPITWSEAFSGGASVASRTIEYSLDGGDSWVTLTTSAGASPYVWDLTTVPNALRALVRVRITDDGSPSFTGQDRSNSTFAIQRAGGDVVGPSVVAGSIRSNPNPINNQQPATLTATVTDSLAGGSNVTAAEWSFGPTPYASGTGFPMSGVFNAPRVAVTATLSTAYFPPGNRKVWVRGQDAAGNWGPATALDVVVNGQVPTSVNPSSTMLALMQNVPNPLHQTTVIPFSLPVSSRIELSIYDLMGRKVRSLARGDMAAGAHHLSWNRSDEAGRPVSAGLYFYRLTVAGKALEHRMVVLQ